MRREYVRYTDNLPIHISLSDIREYPIHWHNALEIIFVLKGSIYLNIEAGTYKVKAEQIEMVNADEAHRIYSDEENLVLILQINPSFFDKYYADMKNMFFYADTSEENIQNTEEYIILKQFVAILLLESIKKRENYQEFINKTLIDLLYHLINHFHYLMYEKEELKDDEEQLQRYHRIVKYIYNNFKNKISLQEIAEKEYLSSHYLSYKIKNTVGISFNEFLNLTRVEEAIKLLLDTDKTLTEISQELGFSHIRYFNKYFKKHYKMTPKEYRKKYKKTEEELKEIKKVKEYSTDLSLDYLKDYLAEYSRYNIEEEIIKIDLNLSDEGKKLDKNYLEKLYFGNFHYLLIEDIFKNLKSIQELLNFKYLIIKDCFKNRNYILFEEGVKKLKVLDLTPYIIISKDEEDIFLSNIDSILENFSSEEVEKWIFEYDKSLDDRIKFSNRSIIYDDKINDIYNTEYMLPYTFKNFMNDDFYMQALDFKEELFSGEYGVLSYQGVKKPSYYSMYFASLLGDKIISKGENHILTCNDEDYQILIFNEGKENVNKEIHFFLNIENLIDDYRVIKYQVDEKNGSSYRIWRSMGKPKKLKDEEIQLIEYMSFPKADIKHAKKSNVFPINFKMFGSGATMIIFKKVQKAPY